MTIGAKTPIVIVNSSMIRSFDAKEVETVLGHEVSHVLSQHYYYTTALVLLSQFLQGALPRSLLLGLPVRTMYLALLEWARAAELSADRAAALIMGDPLQPCRVLMQLAGGSVPGMDFDEFLKQCGRLRQRGRPVLTPHPLLVGAEPHPPGRGPPGEGADRVGRDAAPTTGSEKATTRAGARSRRPRRSSRTPSPTTESASPASWSGRRAACRNWGNASGVGSSAGRAPTTMTGRSPRIESAPGVPNPRSGPTTSVPSVPEGVTSCFGKERTWSGT